MFKPIGPETDQFAKFCGCNSICTSLIAGGAKMPRKKLSPDEHRRRGTFQPVRHGDQAALLGIDETDPETWFRHHSPAEQQLWKRYLASYIPGDRRACYHFISWWLTCETTAYWRAKRGDLGYPESPESKRHSAQRLADLFKATKWRRRR